MLQKQKQTKTGAILQRNLKRGWLGWQDCYKYAVNCHERLVGKYQAFKFKHTCLPTYPLLNLYLIFRLMQAF